MRILLVTPLALAAALIVSCGGVGTGKVDGCQGALSGPYTGGEMGNVTSTLRPAGRLVATFVSSAGAFRAVTATVTDSGSLSSAGGDLVVSGMMDLEECTATGNWTRDALTGTFTLTKK